MDDTIKYFNSKEKSRTGLLGYGRTGYQLACWLYPNHHLFIWESNWLKNKYLKNPLTSHLTLCSPGSTPLLDQLIVSPSIPPSHPICQWYRHHKIPVLSSLEYSLLHIPKSVIKIAITGTNGKSTLTKLIAHVLQAHQVKAYPAENYGIPIAYWQRKNTKVQVFICEISSFQLEWDFHRPYFDLGYITNLDYDHLNRYQSSFKEYCQIKYKLRSLSTQFALHNSCLKYLPIQNGDFVVTNKSIQQVVNQTSKRYFTFQNNHSSSSLSKSNQIVSQWLLHKISSQSLKSKHVYQNFKKPPFRQNHYLVTHYNWTICNDSKATNLAASLYALKNRPPEIQKNTLWWLGGQISLLDWEKYFQEIWQLIQQDSIKILLFGKNDTIHKSLYQTPYLIKSTKNLKEAIQWLRISAHQISQQYFLFSPGGKSFDEFDNYKHRGVVFDTYIHYLNREES